jgi:hypothetical protein
MRRNVDQLGQTFRQMGYESITFAFSTGTGDSPQGDQGSDDAPASSGTAATPSQTGEASTLHSTTLHLDDASTTGVDIRL